MTKRERVINAIEFRQNDFTPYQIYLNQGMYEKMVAYTNQPDYYATVDNHITQIHLVKPEIEIRPGFFQDEYGVVWNRTVDRDIGVVEEYLIRNPEDLDTFAFPAVDEGFIRSCMDTLVTSSNADVFRMTGIGFSLFERAWTLCGMENLLCYMVTEPDFVHRILTKICERNVAIIKIANEYAYDGFYFGDDWGQQKGLIMGPTYWREFIKPYLSKMYNEVKATGRYIAQHSCGDIREIMGDVIDIGLNIYQTFQPEIYGLEYAWYLKNRLTIWGGISTQIDLPFKTPEEIADITKKTLAAFAGGGLIAAPTHSVPDDVPPENIEAMLNVFQNQ